QRRGSVHLHALVRLDERDGAAGAPLFDASRLAAALVQAAKKVSAPGPSGIRHRWGAQLDVALVADEDDRRRRAAAYCAKYATKGVAENGALDRRLTGGVPAHLELPDHLRRLVETAWALGPRGDLQDLRLRAWAHTCGFRGHVLTKSRGYSTTFTALRAERQAWVVAQRRQDCEAMAEEGELESQWVFVGAGYTTAGDAVLAEGIEEELRRGRQIAWEERHQRHTGGP
ncbi:MAG TPA: replication initiator, partial [Acidimicrobiales bacterium]|nr:replication initiator [Acidimicrobiales bacterium]